MEESKKIFGIDLGTTYSCIAHLNKNGEPEVIPNSEGDLITPSVIYFETLQNVVVGKVAKMSADQDPKRVVDFVKRNIGDETFSYEIDGKTFRAEELSAIILKKLVQDASTYLNEPVTDVVITCPAYFGIRERMATENAGKIAGLTVHGVVNEPTAAAICYGIDKLDKSQTVLVYDLGGGTFDITMIDVNKDAISTITTGGDHQLGGKDWDDRIIGYFATSFMEKYGEGNDPRLDPQSMQDLRNKAEEAKKILTTKETYKTVVSCNQQQEKIELSRKKFEELTKDLLNRTIELSKLLLEGAKKTGHPHVDTFLMVGGSSRMPMVRAAIVSDLQMDPIIFEPDMAVAKGAAIIGYYKKQLLTGSTGTIGPDSKSLEFPPINSKAFGVVLTRKGSSGQDENYVYFIIPKHTRLPAEKTEKGFGTYATNQRSVKIELMEQADVNFEPSEKLQDNTSIGFGTIEGLPPNLPANTSIEITFQIKDDGTLALHASCLNKECHFNTKISGVMNENELKGAITEHMGLKIS